MLTKNILKLKIYRQIQIRNFTGKSSERENIKNDPNISSDKENVSGGFTEKFNILFDKFTK